MGGVYLVCGGLRGCKGGFEVLENFLTIIVPRELCKFFEELDNGSGLFSQFWKEYEHGD